MVLLHDIRHRRNRDRKDPVLAAHSSRSLAEFRHDHFRDVQIVQTDGCRGHIYDGIHSSHLVKMHLIHRYAVGFCLRRGKDLKNRKGNLLRSVCHGRRQKDLPDLFHSSVFMVMRMRLLSMTMLMNMMMFRSVMMFIMFRMTVFMMLPVIMAVSFIQMSVKIFHVMIVIFVGFIQDHSEVAGVQSRFLHPGNFRPEAVYAEAPESFFQHFPVRSQVKKGGHRHISADPGITFQI